MFPITLVPIELTANWSQTKPGWKQSQKLTTKQNSPVSPGLIWPQGGAVPGPCCVPLGAACPGVKVTDSFSWVCVDTHNTSAGGSPDCQGGPRQPWVAPGGRRLQWFRAGHDWSCRLPALLTGLQPWVCYLTCWCLSCLPCKLGW